PRALAVPARRAEQLLEALAGALAGHLDQAELGDLQDLGLRLVLLAHRLLQRLVNPLAIARLLHVDEVDDDEAADVAQAKLADDFFGGFEVGARDGLVLILLADVAPGVDVDRRQRLGAIDDQITARLEPHLALERLVDLGIDAEMLEDRLGFLVELDATFEPRGQRVDELED